FRLDRMKRAVLLAEEFEPRADFEPHRLTDARLARVWYSNAVARYQVERGARALKDRSAVSETPVGSEDWLVREVFSWRGDADVPRGDLDRSAHLRVLDGVVDQVAEHLPKALAVGADGRHGPVEIRGQLHLVLAESRRRDRVLDEIGDVDVGEAERERSRLDPRRVEHLRDQRREAGGLVRDQREERVAVLGRELAP